MYGKVQIGDKTVEMLSNAASPVFFRQVFHEDFIAKTAEMNSSNAIDSDLFSKMFFIIAKQAENADPMKLNFNSYIEWISQFELIDLINALPNIATFVFGQMQGDAIPKNEGE